MRFRRDAGLQATAAAPEVVMATEDTYFGRVNALNLWTSNTAYRRHEFDPKKPRGQCGIMNFGAGVFLVWRGVALPDQLLYAEGEIRDGTGHLIDDKHAWLLRKDADPKDKRLYHTDGTIHQYPEYQHGQIVRGRTGNLGPDNVLKEYTVYADKARSPRSTPPEPSAVEYVPQTVTPLDAYDTARFDERLIHFLGSILHPATGLMDHGQLPFLATRMPNTLADDVWLPLDSELSEAHRRIILADPRCDAQRWSSVAQL